MSKLKYYDGTEWKTVNGQITGDTLPIGAIIPYGSTTAPVNWLVCDGSAVSRTTYAELFAIIGTSYGAGDGSTTFNLPNYKGRVPVGYDSSDTDFDTIGEKGGSKTHKHLSSVGFDSDGNFYGHANNDGNPVYGDEIVGNIKRAYNSNFIIQSNTAVREGYTQEKSSLQPYQVSCFIIKAKQSSGLIANVSNTQSNSQTDTYSCDYIEDNFNEKIVYSTTEFDTGKVWIDGKKIYGKTIQITRSSGDGLEYNITFDTTGNIDTIVDIIGIVKKGNMGWPFYRVSDNDQFRFYISNYSKGAMSMAVGSSFPGNEHTANITMLYTKTS